MATIKEMSNVIDSIPMDSPMARGIQPYTLNESKHYLRCVMMNAEEEGMSRNGEYDGANFEPCTYWAVGDYIIAYLTNDLDFDASMLTDDMMDDLIIVEG